LLDGLDLDQRGGVVHHASVTLSPEVVKIRDWRTIAISAGTACSGTMGDCLPRDYGCAAVTHVRQNRIRAIRLRSLNCSVAITGEVA
jgi:hypothetical protein